MNDTFKLLLSLSLSGSILAGLIFILRPFIKYRMSKSVQYFLWIIVLLRFVLPFSFNESIMNNLFYNDAAPSGITAVAGVNSEGNPIKNEEVVHSDVAENNSTIDAVSYKYDYYRNDIIMILTALFNRYGVIIWLTGSIIALYVNISGYVRFSKQILNANKKASDDDYAILGEVCLTCYKEEKPEKLQIFRNALVTTPMLMGLMNPIIIIPDIKISEKELKNLLLHEITHFRHCDIAIKWLSMAVASLHWFNPIVYIIKKEVSRACELACDEAVIKNLSANEKQAYGDTLISLAADNRFPSGVLQATLSEEKRNLAERLTAIMKHGKKSGFVIGLSAVLVLLIVFAALLLGAVSSRSSASPPTIFISTETNPTKKALRGTYSWTRWNTHIEADSDHPANFQYAFENIVSASSGQQLVVGTQQYRSDKKYEFTLENMEIYKEGSLVQTEGSDAVFIDNNLYLHAPEASGEYVYCLNLRYGNQGEASYGFIVRVNLPTYNLSEISKHRTPYVGNHSKVLAITGNLPVPDMEFTQRYISLQTDRTPYGATVYYEPASGTGYSGEWPITRPSESFRSIMEKNALVMFCMIDNVDEVTFAFRNSQSANGLDETKYDTSFTITRDEIADIYGNLDEMSQHINILAETLEGKISAFKGLELYVWRKPEITGNNDLYYTLLPGTNRNKTADEVYDLSVATSDLDKIKKNLSQYRSGTYLAIIHGADIDKETMSPIADSLSGTIKNSVTTVGVRELPE